MSRHTRRALQSIKARQAIQQYQDACLSTNEGRRALRLETQAIALQKRGEYERGHKLLLEALALFTPMDDGAAVSRVRYNLALSFKNRSEGVSLENLCQAHALLERARQSKARKRDRYRLSQTLDALGQVMRCIAEHQASHAPDRIDVLKKATHHIEDAIRLAQEIDPVALSELHRYCSNLGNVWLERGNPDKARRYYERAIREFKRHEQSPIFPDTTGITSLIPYQLNLLQVMSPETEREDIVRMCDVIISQGNPLEILRARLTKIGALITSSDTHELDLARTELRHIDPHHIDFRFIVQVARYAHQLGESAFMLGAFDRGMSKALSDRQRARADHVADERALEAQGVARALVLLLLSSTPSTTDMAHVMRIFLALENTSSLRYYDSVSQFAYQPAHPIHRELHRYYCDAQMLSAYCQDMYGRLGRGPGDSLQETLELLVNEVSKLEEDGDLHAAIVDLLQHASMSPHPLVYLASQSEHWSQKALELRELLDQHAPEMRRNGVFEYDTSEAVLRDLIEEHEEKVLVRISLLPGDLIASAIWKSPEGEFVGRAQRFPCHPELVSTLVEMARQGSAKASGEDVLNDFLSGLPLHELLKGCERRVLVLLPSLYASLVPWVAAEGVLDRFDSIIYLPSLVPLMMRQAPHAPRQGMLTAYPGRATRPVTHFHGVAFEDHLPDETRLSGQACTRDTVCRDASRADVVVFYAHGEVGEMAPPTLRLGDGAFTPHYDIAAWRGCERVELWACQTGVNLPHDPLTPLVDEAFGLDIAFHQVGVRSTIGTLWKASDFVTGLLVRHYRRRLEQGRTSPEALADAQRWWRREALPELEKLLGEHGEQEAIRKAVARLGVDPGELDGFMVHVLGPVPARSPVELERLLRMLTSTTAWAGYRFVGVSERRPDAPWSEDYKRPLTTEEEVKLEELMSAPRERYTLDEVIEARLDEARQGAPTPEHAIRVARLYRLRNRSSTRHNLLRGLAWLHEAYHAHRGEPGDENFVRLRLEAAWLWLELARDEVVIESARVITPVNRVLIHRIETLLEGLDDSAEGRIIRAWVALLTPENLIISPEQWEAHARRCHDLARDAIEEVHRHEELVVWRAHYAMAELLAAVGELGDGLTRELEVHREQWREGVPHSFEAQLFWFRLQGVLSLTCDDVPPPALDQVDHHRIHDIIRAYNRRALAHTHEPHVLNMLADHYYRGINILEMDTWGSPSEPMVSSIELTGGIGRPWCHLVGSYLVHQLQHECADAVHTLATLHMSADLRIAPLRRMSTLPDNLLWSLMREREEFLMYLDDSAGQFLCKDGEVHPHIAESHSVYDRRVGELLQVEPDRPSALVGWCAAMALELGDDDTVNTAAFLLEQRLLDHESHLRRFGEGFDTKEIVPEDIRGLLRTSMLPSRKLSDIEAHVRTLPEGHMILGVGAGGMGEVLLTTLWREHGTLQERHHLLGKPGMYDMCVLFLSKELFVNVSSDSQGSLKKDLTFVQQVLGDELQHVLPKDFAGGDGVLHLFVPGPLRGLPLQALVVRGKPLRDHFGAVQALIELGTRWEDPDRDTSRVPVTVCINGARAQDASTCFGDAAVRTRRALYEPVVAAEVNRVLQESTIIETDVIEEHMLHIDVLRVYGRAYEHTRNPSTEGITIREGRCMSAYNFQNTRMPTCRWVELWAASGDMGVARAMSESARDVIPQMVRAALISGASGVLDLAWEVPDLVKALVYEAFGHYTYSGVSPAHALNMALREVGHLLSRWQTHAGTFSNVKQALEWLDVQRCARLGLAEENRLSAFARHAHVVLCAHHEFITDMNHPSHLASFRWWHL